MRNDFRTELLQRGTTSGRNYLRTELLWRRSLFRLRSLSRRDNAIDILPPVVRLFFPGRRLRTRSGLRLGLARIPQLFQHPVEVQPIPEPFFRHAADALWHRPSTLEHLIAGAAEPSPDRIRLFLRRRPHSLPLRLQALHFRLRGLLIEIDPASKEVVWSFEGTGNQPFYAKARGEQQLLPNGNILISDPHHGRVFEIAPSADN